MVLSIGVGGQADYYLKHQADYYTGGCEPQGKWYTPDGTFGLADRAPISPEIFRSLDDGIAPDGTVIGRAPTDSSKERVRNYDLTFSAPKSVSILWAIADQDTRRQIEALQEDAVRRALATAQQHAAWIRRGRNGVDKVPTRVFGATFQHGDARPLEARDGSVVADPNLHTHAVIFNLGQDERGEWYALDGHQVLRWKMALGATYHAELASLFRSRLGALTAPRGKNGTFEVVGVGTDLIARFSRRRHQIVALMKEHGLTTADAPDLAAALGRNSREAKAGAEAAETPDQRFRRWAEEAGAAGFSCEEVYACLYRPVAGHEAARAAEEFRAAVAELPFTLTETESMVETRDIVRHAAALCADHGQSADRAEALVAEMFSDSRIVSLPNVTDEVGCPVYSAPDLIAKERNLQRLVREGLHDRRHVLPYDLVERHIAARSDAGHPLTEEQAHGLRWVTTEPGLVSVLEGAGGSGKSYSLKEVTALYRDAFAALYGNGYRILGSSAKWLTAKALVTDAELVDEESRAAAKWIADFRAGKEAVDERTILIIDEGGQMGSRDLHDIMQPILQAGGKVIISGDGKQQRAVGAGPALDIVVSVANSLRLEKTQRMRAQADDVLVHRDGLSREEAIVRAWGLSADRQQRLLWGLDAATRAEVMARYRDRHYTVTPADVLIWADGLDPADAAEQAARLSRADAARLTRGQEAVVRDAALGWAADRGATVTPAHVYHYLDGVPWAVAAERARFLPAADAARLVSGAAALTKTALLGWASDPAVVVTAADVLVWVEGLPRRQAEAAAAALAPDAATALVRTHAPAARRAAASWASDPKMRPSAEDALHWVDGLSWSQAFDRVDGLSQEHRDALVTAHGADAIAAAEQWALTPEEAITPADVYVHAYGLGRPEAERRAATLGRRDAARLLDLNRAAVAHAGQIWTRQAATDISYGRITAALEAFTHHGQMTWVHTHDDALRAAVEEWKAYKRQHPDHTAAVLAKSNVDVRALNLLMRDHLRERGYRAGGIGPEDHFIRSITRSGHPVDLPLAPGDQLLFTKRNDDLGVYNGTNGRLLAIAPSPTEGHALLTVEIGERTVRFDTAAYADEKTGAALLEHAYALTVYSAQGLTVDACFAQIDSTMRRNVVYVATSRARQLTRLYASRSVEDEVLRAELTLTERRGASFTDRDRLRSLCRHVERAQKKTSTLDAYDPDWRSRGTTYRAAGYYDDEELWWRASPDTADAPPGRPPAPAAATPPPPRSLSGLSPRFSRASLPLRLSGRDAPPLAAARAVTMPGVLRTLTFPSPAARSRIPSFDFPLWSSHDRALRFDGVADAEPTPALKAGARAAVRTLGHRRIEMTSTAASPSRDPSQSRRNFRPYAPKKRAGPRYDSDQIGREMQAILGGGIDFRQVLIDQGWRCVSLNNPNLNCMWTRGSTTKIDSSQTISVIKRADSGWVYASKNGERGAGNPISFLREFAGVSHSKGGYIEAWLKLRDYLPGAPPLEIGRRETEEEKQARQAALMAREEARNREQRAADQRYQEEAAAAHARNAESWTRLITPAASGAENYLDGRGITRSTQYAYADSIRFHPEDGWVAFRHTTPTGAITGYERKRDGFNKFTMGVASKSLAIFGDPGSEVRRIAVVETGVDALSLAQIDGCPPDTLYVSTGGNRGPEGEAHMLALARRHPQALIEIATDRDRGGNTQAAHWTALLAAHPGGLTRRLPERTRDWNNEVRLASAALLDPVKYMEDLRKADPPMPPPLDDRFDLLPSWQSWEMARPHLDEMRRAIAARVGALADNAVDERTFTAEGGRRLYTAVIAAVTAERQLPDAIAQVVASAFPGWHSWQSQKEHVARLRQTLAKHLDAWNPDRAAVDERRLTASGARDYLDAIEQAVRDGAALRDAIPAAIVLMEKSSTPQADPPPPEARGALTTLLRDVVTRMEAKSAEYEIPPAQPADYPVFAALIGMAERLRVERLPLPDPAAWSPDSPKAPLPAITGDAIPGTDVPPTPTPQALPGRASATRGDAAHPSPRVGSRGAADFNPGPELALPSGRPAAAAGASAGTTPSEPYAVITDPLVPIEEFDMDAEAPPTTETDPVEEGRRIAAAAVQEQRDADERTAHESAARRVRAQERRNRNPDGTPVGGAYDPAPLGEVGEDFGVDRSDDRKRHEFLKQLGQFYETNLAEKHEQDIEWVRMRPGPHADEVVVQFRDRSRLRDDGRNIYIDGTPSPQKAALIIEIAQAKRLTSVRVRGTWEFKKDLAFAAYKAGIRVENPELAGYLADLRRRFPELEASEALDRPEQDAHAANDVPPAPPLGPVPQVPPMGPLPLTPAIAEVPPSSEAETPVIATGGDLLADRLRQMAEERLAKATAALEVATASGAGSELDRAMAEAAEARAQLRTVLNIVAARLGEPTDLPASTFADDAVRLWIADAEAWLQIGGSSPGLGFGVEDAPDMGAGSPTEGSADGAGPSKDGSASDTLGGSLPAAYAMAIAVLENDRLPEAERAAAAERAAGLQEQMELAIAPPPPVPVDIADALEHLFEDRAVAERWLVSLISTVGVDQMAQVLRTNPGAYGLRETGPGALAAVRAFSDTLQASDYAATLRRLVPTAAAGEIRTALHTSPYDPRRLRDIAQELRAPVAAVENTTRQAAADVPDASSAEWVAEPPPPADAEVREARSYQNPIAVQLAAAGDAFRLATHTPDRVTFAGVMYANAALGAASLPVLEQDFLIPTAAATEAVARHQAALAEANGRLVDAFDAVYVDPATAVATLRRAIATQTAGDGLDLAALQAQLGAVRPEATVSQHNRASSAIQAYHHAASEAAKADAALELLIRKAEAEPDLAIAQEIRDAFRELPWDLLAVGDPEDEVFVSLRIDPAGIAPPEHPNATAYDDGLALLRYAADPVAQGITQIALETVYPPDHPAFTRLDEMLARQSTVNELRDAIGLMDQANPADLVSMVSRVQQLTQDAVIAEMAATASQDLTAVESARAHLAFADEASYAVAAAILQSPAAVGLAEEQGMLAAIKEVHARRSVDPFINEDTHEPEMA